nr:SDR family oxidoreductase [Paenibacillus albus]
MRKIGKGKIINISSVHGNLTMPQYAVYASTKGGMNAMTRQLALDLAPYHINVNAVAPGATEVEKFSENPNHDKYAVGKQIPLGRIGYPEDVAAAVTFLASSGSDFITGQTLTVDGGSSTRFFLQ